MFFSILYIVRDSLNGNATFVFLPPSSYFKIFYFKDKYAIYIGINIIYEINII